MRAARPLLALFLALPAFGATFGTVVARPEGFSDIVLDEARRRLYLVNTTAGTVDVYQTTTNTHVIEVRHVRHRRETYR